jgi:hypothetical protein
MSFRAPTTAIGAPRSGRMPRGAPSPLTALRARMRSWRLDRELASGAAPWSSPLHAARALQLTSGRRRRSLARSLESLCAAAEQHRTPRLTASVPPARDQVHEARRQLLAIAATLRSGGPVDARGVARLWTMLTDGNGPCYRSTHPAALAEALQTASRWLRAAD